MARQATEKDMLDLLRAKYTGPTTISSTGLPRYIYAEQVANMWESPVRRIDAIALDSREPSLQERKAFGTIRATDLPLTVHGFEVKVSRSDARHELSLGGEKSSIWEQYCSHWWLVIPSDDIIQGLDLPDHWGVMVGTKRLKILKEAQRRRQTTLPDRLHLMISRIAQKNLLEK